MPIRGPTDEQRTVFIGRTGAGKTQAACNLLSKRNFNEMPWVIIDYKGDQLIQEICEQCNVTRIKVKDNPPKKPGLYVMSPVSGFDDDAVELWLMKCHAQENIGLYIDEGYALPKEGKTRAFTAILTQGRSKKIPVIILYQRPFWMTKFAVAQADFFNVFEQNITDDLKQTNTFIKPAISPIGEKITVHTKLPKYYSLWYDVSEGLTSVLRPAPARDQILSIFRARLKPQSKRTLA